MITIKSAVLCDAASIRDGLLHMLGGGISLFGRESFPAPFDATLALVFELSNVSHTGESHAIDIRAHRFGGLDSPIFEVHTVITTEPGADPEAFQYAPFVFNLRNAGLPEAGSYEITVHLDGAPVTSVRFHAKLSEIPEASDREPFA